MHAYAIPIGIILFQLLALLVTIAVEAAVFYERFVLTRKQSLEYSIILNLFSSAATWVLFFVFQRIAPEFLRLELISYVFLNKFYRGLNLISIPSVLMIFGIINFFFVCIVEFFGSSVLQNLASIEPTLKTERTSEVPVINGAKGKKETIPLMTALVLNDPDLTVTLLTANTVSNGLIFLLFCILGLLY